MGASFYIYIYMQKIDLLLTSFLEALHFGMVHVHVIVIQQAPFVKRHSALLPVPIRRPAQTVVPAFTMHHQVRVLVYVLLTLGQVCMCILKIQKT